MGKQLVSLVAAALIALCGCGKTSEQGPKDTSPGKKRAAGARVRPEIGRSGAPAGGAPYRVRNFRPVGTGTLTLDGKRHNFQVADCRLQPEKLPSGWVRDIWVSAAGRIAGQPYFFTFNRASKGKNTNVSLAVYLAPLPADLEVGGYSTGRPEALTAMEAVHNAASLRSFGLAGLRDDQIRVQGARVETTGTFQLQRFELGGLADAPPVEARLELICEG